MVKQVQKTKEPWSADAYVLRTGHILAGPAQLEGTLVHPPCITLHLSGERTSCVAVFLVGYFFALVLF